MKSSGTEITIALIVAIPLTVLWAWITSIMWSWFIVPLGLPQIGLAHAWGLSIFILMFSTGSKKGDQSALEMVLSRAIGALLLFGLGWIAHSLM